MNISKKIAIILLPLSFNSYAFDGFDFLELNKVNVNFGVSNFVYSSDTERENKVTPFVGYNYQLYDEKTKFGVGLYGDELLQGFLTYNLYGYGKFGTKFKSSLEYRLDQKDDESTLTPSFGLIGVYNFNNRWRANIGYDYRVDNDSMVSVFFSYKFGVNSTIYKSVSTKTNKIVDYIVKEKAPKLVLRDESRGLFDFDSFNISSDGRKQILDFLSSLDIERISNIYIEGHTDSKGESKYNWELSRKRSEAVFNLIKDNSDIDPYKINYYGLGETQLISDLDNENRRVEIKVHYKYPAIKKGAL